jgi:hypothetical protein
MDMGCITWKMGGIQIKVLLKKTQIRRFYESAFYEKEAFMGKLFNI